MVLPDSKICPETTTSRRQDTFEVFKIVKCGDFHGVQSLNVGVFARLDQITSGALQTLEKFQTCRVTAVIEKKFLSQTKSGGKSKGIFPLSVNVFGPEDEADKVGETLADASIFLQHPCFLEDGIQYCNPQYFYPDNRKTYLTDIIGLSERELRAKRLSDEVEGVFASLDDVPFIDTSTDGGIPCAMVTVLRP